VGGLFISGRDAHLTEITMDDTKAYPSNDAAESVGERPGMKPPQTREHAVRPVETSAGPGARIAEKTAEEVGERTGAAYADATTEEARERSRAAVRHGARGGWPDGTPSFQLDPQTFVTLVAGFAVGYATALLIQRSSR
jgi:hypothetical protein